MSDEVSDNTKASEPTSFATFLVQTPPSTNAQIADLITVVRHGPTSVSHYLSTPAILLHCPTLVTCEGSRVFRKVGYAIELEKQGRPHDLFLEYACSNCGGAFKKTFCLNVVRREGVSGVAYKYGEFPAFGPITPARLLRLIQDDKDLFLKGRSCESLGHGLGAFAYYRRVVERQRNRIFDRLIAVSKKLHDSDALIAELEDAKRARQFLESVQRVKKGLPSALLVDGHNPLTSLHTALSDGLHARDDAHCLELATTIRLVLINLSERMSQILKEDKDLKAALGRLQAAPHKQGRDDDIVDGVEVDSSLSEGSRESVTTAGNEAGARESET